MKTNLKSMVAAIATLFLTATTAVAQNPIAQTCFSTDPAPIVHGDRLYVFTGHDEDGADFFWRWRQNGLRDAEVFH